MSEELERIADRMAEELEDFAREARAAGSPMEGIETLLEDFYSCPVIKGASQPEPVMFCLAEDLVALDGRNWQ